MFLVSVLALVAVCASTNGTGEGVGCKTSPTMVGGRGTMTFTFRPDLDMTSDTFHAYVIQEGHTANVVQCDRRDNTGITCDTINKAFNPTSIVNHTLTLTADNVSPGLTGNYTLVTMVGGSREPPVKCTFVVKNGTEAISGDTINWTAVKIAVPVVCSVIIVATAVFFFVLCKKRNRERRAEGQIEMPDQPGSDSAHPMLSADEADGRSDKLDLKRWYFNETSHNFETKLAKFWRNGEGSFLIAKDHEEYFTLAVCDGKGNINHLRISKTDSGYKVDDTERDPFPTLSELVAHYHDHDIETATRNFGKLVKPFEEKPKEVWYAEKLKRKEAARFFRFKGKPPGSFLIRDNITYSNCYTLAVNVHGKMKTFRISLNDESFILDDATGRKHFTTLAELVDYYQKNTLDTVKGDKVLLVRPIQVRSTCCPCI